MEEVPLIDVSSLFSSDITKRKGTIAEITSALEHLAFFQIINHGVDPQLIEKMDQCMKSFFLLPQPLKETVSRTPTNARGYFSLMSELTKRKRDWKEGFDFGSVRADVPDETRGLDGFNQWPSKPEQFREVMTQYFEALERLALVILSAISEALGYSNPNHLYENYLKDASSFIRLNHYPPKNRAADQNGDLLGVGPHSDPGIITLLLQDDIPGLQVLNKENKWVDVKPIRNAFVFNTGDMLHVWSNGRFPATQHRVVTNPNHERFSVPFFLTPSLDADISPLDVCVNENNPPKFATVNYGKFINERHAGNQQDLGEEIQISNFMRTY